MSEFKFACPVCGQHITADSGSTGSQLECPTCYRKIIVPQAPASADSKFILSAAEANKPRPPQPSLPGAALVAKEPARTGMPVALWIALILLCLLGTVAFAFREKIFGPKKSDATQTAVAAGETNDDGTPPAGKSPPVPVVTNNVAWNLDLADAAYPEAGAAGKLRGEFVACNRNTLTGGALGFRQSVRGLPDLSVTIYFFAKQPDELRGKTINVTTNDTLAPRVTVRWKEGKDTRSESFTNGYALKLEFAEFVGNRAPGKIYLSLPDESQSRIAGTFNADIRKLSPPKPKPAKPRPGV